MSLMQRQEAILNWFTPAEFREDPHARKRVHMFVISHILGPFVASPIPIFLLLNDPQPWPHVWILACSIFGFWLFLPILKLLGRFYRPIAMVSITNFSFAVLWGAYNYGGPSSPFIAWFLVMPLVAFFYFGADKQTRAFVFGEIAVGIGILFSAHQFGGSFPIHIPNEQLVSVGLLSVFSSASYVFFMAAYYSNIVDSQSALLREVDEHKKTMQELKTSKDIAERASGAKSEFLAKMSHELRTPLNAVLGYTEILLEDAEIDGNGGQIADLNKISAAGKHLLAMVNDILDISKIEAGRMDLNVEPIDLARLVDEIEFTARPLAAKNANRFEVDRADDLGVIRSDPTKLRQIIFNLLSNAAKFTQNGVITLKVGPDPARGGDRVAISVMDTGIGISRQQLDSLFSNFSQADARISAVYGGTGLGLSLSRHLAHLLGGDIAVTSELDVGSAFTILLPRDAGGAAAPAPADPVLADAEAALAERKSGFAGLSGHAPDHRKRQKVLVIDDDVAFLQLAERMLAKLGYSAVCTPEPSAALQLARTVRPCAILLDILMPGMDGWEVMQTLRSDTATASLPVVLLSVVDERAKARTERSDGFLLKPLDPAKLSDVLTRLDTTAVAPSAAGSAA